MRSAGARGIELDAVAAVLEAVGPAWRSARVLSCSLSSWWNAVGSPGGRVASGLRRLLPHTDC